jgi:hypothetical protein
MRRLLVAAIALVTLAVAGCSTIQNIEGAFNVVTTSTVSPGYANVAINTYYALKETAVNYGQYCIAQKFPQPVCSASNRRAVIRFVKAGDGAVSALQPALSSGQPLLSTAYNSLVGAINGLKASPIATVNSGN